MSNDRDGPATRLEEAQKQATLAIGKTDDRIVSEDAQAAVRLIEAALNRLDREGDE